MPTLSVSSLLGSEDDARLPRDASSPGNSKVAAASPIYRSRSSAIFIAYLLYINYELHYSISTYCIISRKDGWSTTDQTTATSFSAVTLSLTEQIIGPSADSVCSSAIGYGHMAASSMACPCTHMVMVCAVAPTLCCLPASVIKSRKQATTRDVNHNLY
jgi:hypothetical protein